MPRAEQGVIPNPLVALSDVLVLSAPDYYG